MILPGYRYSALGTLKLQILLVLHDRYIVEVGQFQQVKHIFLDQILVYLVVTDSLNNVVSHIYSRSVYLQCYELEKFPCLEKVPKV
jgi:hypothetical protein